MVSVDKEYSLSERDFAFLGKLIYDKTGIVINENKKDLLYSRLSRRLKQLNLETFSEYCNFLQTSAAEDEMEPLINAVTTNLTDFFRENHHFEHLAELLVALAGKGQSRIRIWSSACSSGQEPYSIAMVVAKTIKKHSNIDIKILATDIDTGMLDKCKKGIYSINDIKNIDENDLNKYFTKLDSSHYQVNDEIKNIITFNRLNLLEPWPMRGSFDVIFCRNVVIYFDKDTQRKLFSRMAEHLVDSGTLYIGHSENLNQVSNQFKLVGKTIYQKI